MKTPLPGRRVLPLASLLLLGLLLTSVAPVTASHEPLYKAGIDRLRPGEWEAHFVWLRSPHFNFLGEVWWRFEVQGGRGEVDALFLDWTAFQAFRDGEPHDYLVEPLEQVNRGYAFRSGLTSDLPYFLVLQNRGGGGVNVAWAIFAELDWRRWQGQEPGPTLRWSHTASSPNLASGESWGMALVTPGFYLMTTRPHIDTTGIIEVTSAAAPAPRVEVALRDNGLHPEILKVPAGTPLQWTNHDDWNITVDLGPLHEGLDARSSPLPDESSPWLPPLLTAAVTASILAGLWGWRRRRRPVPPDGRRT